MNGYLGEVRLFSGDFAPRNWLICAGQILVISQYDALFSIISNTYGGDGKTTFALPDLRGRAAIGVGQGPGLSSRKRGQHVGVEQVLLDANQMPSHTHEGAVQSATASLYTSSLSGTSGTPATGDAISADTGNASFLYGPNEPDVKMAAGSIQGITAKITVGNTGGSNSHENMQPSLVLNYIICITGVYPERN